MTERIPVASTAATFSANPYPLPGFNIPPGFTDSAAPTLTAPAYFNDRGITSVQAPWCPGLRPIVGIPRSHYALDMIRLVCALVAPVVEKYGLQDVILNVNEFTDHDTFGEYHFKSRYIKLRVRQHTNGNALAALRSLDSVVDTMLHELAHAYMYKLEALWRIQVPASDTGHGLNFLNINKMLVRDFLAMSGLRRRNFKLHAREAACPICENGAENGTLCHEHIILASVQGVHDPGVGHVPQNGGLPHNITAGPDRHMNFQHNGSGGHHNQDPSRPNEITSNHTTPSGLEHGGSNTHPSTIIEHRDQSAHLHNNNSRGSLRPLGSTRNPGSGIGSTSFTRESRSSGKQPEQSRSHSTTVLTNDAGITKNKTGKGSRKNRRT